MFGSPSKPLRPPWGRDVEAAKPGGAPSQETTGSVQAIVASVTQSPSASAANGTQSAGTSIWSAVTQRVRNLAAADVADERHVSLTDEEPAAPGLVEDEARPVAPAAAKRAHSDDGSPLGEAGDPAPRAAVSPVVQHAVTPAVTPARTGGNAGVTAVAPLKQPVPRVAPAMKVRRQGRERDGSTSRLIVWGVVLAGAAVVVGLLISYVAPPAHDAQELRSGCRKDGTGCGR